MSIKAEGLVDANERREVVRELEKLLQEDGPIAQPLWRNTFTAFDKRVKNVAMHPTGYYFPDLLALDPA